MADFHLKGLAASMSGDNDYWSQILFVRHTQRDRTLRAFKNHGLKKNESVLPILNATTSSNPKPPLSSSSPSMPPPYCSPQTKPRYLSSSSPPFQHDPFEFHRPACLVVSYSEEAGGACGWCCSGDSDGR